jgi:hypothetical protein
MDESSYKRGGSPFDFDMASELFRESFGQQLCGSLAVTRSCTTKKSSTPPTVQYCTALVVMH